MATDIQSYIGTFPGISQVGRSRMHFAQSDPLAAFMADNRIAAIVQKKVLMALGGLMPPYSTSDLAATIDGGTIANGANGILFTTSTTNDHDQALNGNKTIALAQDKWFTYLTVVQFSHATSVGLRAGVVTSGGTEYFTADATDGVYFVKAKNAATLTARVVENGNAAVDLSTFTLSDGTSGAFSFVAATRYVIGFRFKVGSSADLTAGEWIVNGVITKMSAAQITALRAMLATTAPTLCAHLGNRLDSTTSRTMTVDGICVEADL